MPAEGLEMRVTRFDRDKTSFFVVRRNARSWEESQQMLPSAGFSLSLSLSCDMPLEPDGGSSGPSG